MAETQAPVYLRLQRSWTFFPIENQGYELASMIKRKILKISGPLPAIKTLLEALAEGVPADDAVGILSRSTRLSEADVESILRKLAAADATLTSKDSGPLRTDIDSLYHRQIGYMDLFETAELTGKQINDRLQNSKVVIPGLGGAGVWLALECARLGIKHIVGIDPDVVETSNLSRQVLYSREDVGSLKIDACKRALANVDDEVVFEGHDVWLDSCRDLEPFLEGADFVFNIFAYQPLEIDTNRTKETIALAALHAGVPSIGLTTSWVGPLTVPRQSACMRCVIRTLDQTLAGTDHDAAAGFSMVDHFVKASYSGGAGYGPRMMPRIAVTASVGVWEMTRLLSGIDHPPSMDGLIVLEMVEYKGQRLLPVQRDPACEWCGNEAPSAPHSDVYVPPVHLVGEAPELQPATASR